MMKIKKHKFSTWREVEVAEAGAAIRARRQTAAATFRKALAAANDRAAAQIFIAHMLGESDE